jgi:hypothetical protein
MTGNNGNTSGFFDFLPNIFGSSGNNGSSMSMPRTQYDTLLRSNEYIDFENPSAGGGSGISSFGKLGTNGGMNTGIKNNTLSDLTGIAQLIQGLSGLYTGFVGNQQARRSLNFTKDAFNRQNAQQVKTYNNYLEDRARSRFGIEGKSQTEADAFIKKQSL